MIDAPSRRSTSGGNRRALVHNFSDGLTINWASDYPDGVTIEGFRLRCKQADFLLDYAPRRQNNTPWRRAIVHDFSDGLTLNWANDYPGGVTINGNVSIPGQLSVPNRSGRGTVDVASELSTLKSRIVDLETRLSALER